MSHFSTIGKTTLTARMLGKTGAEMKLQISDTTKQLLDKIGGFRCEHRGVVDLGVSFYRLLYVIRKFRIYIIKF